MSRSEAVSFPLRCYIITNCTTHSAIRMEGSSGCTNSKEIELMCPVAKGAYHGPAPIPEEGKWVQAKEISDISGFTHGVGLVRSATRCL